MIFHLRVGNKRKDCECGMLGVLGDIKEETKKWEEMGGNGSVCIFNTYIQDNFPSYFVNVNRQKEIHYFNLFKNYSLKVHKKTPHNSTP